jgi:hypothetical protein
MSIGAGPLGGLYRGNCPHAEYLSGAQPYNPLKSLAPRTPLRHHLAAKLQGGPYSGWPDQ